MMNISYPVRRYRATAALMAALAMSLLPLTLSAGEVKQFNIKSQPLLVALGEFARQSDRQILFSTETVAAKETTGISGSLDAEAALRMLLKGTGLTYRITEENTILVEARHANDRKAGNARQDVRFHLARVEAPATKEVVAADTEKAAGTSKTGNLGEMEVRSTKVDGIVNKSLLPTDKEAPLYYNVIDRETIDRLGITSIEELFRYVPQTNSPATSLQAAENNVRVSGGTVQNYSRIGMRGFEQSQTLILVNGRTLPRAGTFKTSGTDISRIPIQAIERVEILPSSASALYGAGSIGGAINVILRKDYSGQDLTAYVGTSYEGGAGEYRVSYLNGKSFNEGQSSVTLTFDYQHRDPLVQGDRNYIDRVLERYPVNTTLTGAGGQSAFELYTLPALAANPGTIVASSVSQDLGIPGAPGARIAAIPLGTSPGDSLLLTPDSFVGTAGTANFGERFKRMTIYQPEDNYSIDAQMEHEFTPRLRAFGQMTLRYLRKDYSYVQYGNVISLSATDPLNPFRTDVTPGFVGRAVDVYIDPSDIPDPSSLEERTNVRLTLGVAGKLADSWEWSLDLTGDRNRSTNSSDNSINILRTYQSLTLSSSSYPNAASAEVRRAAYPLLADHNMYPVSQQALDEIWHSYRFSDARVENYDVLARLSGDVFTLPAGEAQVSLRAQYTDFNYRGAQYYLQSQGYQDLLGRDPGDTDYGFVPDSNRAALAGAIEAVVPVISDRWQPLPIDSLDFNFAYRREQNETSGDYYDGTPFSGTKYASVSVIGVKIGLIPDVALRASYSEGFYPPDWNNISQPVSPYFINSTYLDPLRGNTAQGSANPIEVVNGGNPGLLPEESESTNIGLIFKPRFIPGLTLLVDYWKTKKVNGIERIIFNRLIPRADQFADLVTRAEPTAMDIANGWAGIILSLNQTDVNLALQETDGFDIQTQYDFDAGEMGSFFFSSNFSFTNRFDEQLTASAPAINIVGGAGPVRWRGYGSLGWTRERLGVTLTGNYVGHYSTTTTAPTPSYPDATGIDGDRIPSTLLWDTQVRYEIPYEANASGARFWLTGTRFTLGILNLFNEEPALVTNSRGYYNNYQDPRQRYMYLTVKKSF